MMSYLCSILYQLLAIKHLASRKMRKNQFNACKPKKFQHISATPGLPQGKQGLPKVSISLSNDPTPRVRANFKPRAKPVPGPSKEETRMSSESNETGFQSSIWDSLDEEPPVIIHDMDFEPADGFKNNTKVPI